MEEVFRDVFNNKILLPNKRWNHIISEHPEIKFYKDKIYEVLRNPDLVKRSKRNKDIFLYYRYYDNIYDGKYLLVVTKMKENPLILTYYITDRIKKGDLIWEKN